jgi:predicted DNA-binding transcriptional regulator YafY
MDSICPTSPDILDRMKNIRNFKRQDLIRIGLDSKLCPAEALFHWMARPRNPVLASDDPLANMFIEAMLAGEPVEFIYVGGSKPGSPRKVSVSLVFQHVPEGRIYVAGYCPERAANRVFSLDLIMVVYEWN